MSNESCPYLLVLVEGPSEARTGESHAEPGGIVVAIIAHVFGDEVARNIKVVYWKQIPSSPLRSTAERKRFRTPAEKVRDAVKLAHETTAYGAVILVDNDHLYDRERSIKLEELREGVESSGLRDRVAYGVATEMIEAWLLADSSLVRVPLPAGKRCEELWGDKHDAESNHPKHVLTRCVLTPGRLSFVAAVNAWKVGNARPNACSLDAFVRDVEGLADRHYVR